MRRVFLALSLLSFFLPASLHAQLEKVSFKTRDGKKLTAIFRAPDAGKSVVVMLHGLAAVKEEWEPLEKKLDQEGWGFLAYDARGHGESSATRDEKGAPDGWARMGRPGAGSQWERMIDDVGAALAFLANEKNVEHKSVFLAGASLGANVVLNYLSLTRSVRGAVLLSPGLNYQDIRTEEPIKAIKNTPLLFVASQADRYAYVSSQKLEAVAVNGTLWTDVKPGHGVQMFDEKLLGRIMEWLKQH